MEKSAISLVSDAGVIRRLDLGPVEKHDTCDHGIKATGIVRARKSLPSCAACRGRVCPGGAACTLLACSGAKVAVVVEA